MLLYLFRHGEAEPRAASDSLRRLTSKGHQDIGSVARQFLVNQLPLQRCLCSPYFRAQETAWDFLQQVQPGLKFEESSLLTPDMRAGEIMKLLATFSPDTPVLLVSHNPLMSELNALLTEGNINQMHILGTSELVAISIDVIWLGMGKTVLRLLPETLSQPD